MKLVKTKHRTLLTDRHLEDTLRIATTDIDLVGQIRHQTSSIINRLLPKSYNRNKQPKRPFSLGKLTNFTRKLCPKNSQLCCVMVTKHIFAVLYMHLISYFYMP